MNEKEVLIAVAQELFPQFLERWDEPQTLERLRNTFGANIRVLDAIPQWPTAEQLQYLESIGVPVPEPENYRVRIGPEVEDIAEHKGGADLPASVLATTGDFQREVVTRLRAAIGAPEDN